LTVEQHIHTNTYTYKQTHINKTGTSQPIDQLPYYYGGIGRPEAEKILNTAKMNKAFLLRDSSVSHSYSLSIFNNKK
jgi:hypothetical protein